MTGTVLSEADRLDTGGEWWTFRHGHDRCSSANPAGPPGQPCGQIRSMGRPPDISAAMEAMLLEHARRGWWRWGPGDRPDSRVLLPLQRRGLIWVKTTVPMFPDVPGDRRTASVLTNEGLEELESMGHEHGWRWGRFDG